MNSERMIHRSDRREINRFALLMGKTGVPYEVFRSAAYSDEQAAEEYESFNLSVERAGAEGGTT